MMNAEETGADNIPLSVFKSLNYSKGGFEGCGKCVKETNNLTKEKIKHLVFAIYIAVILVVSFSLHEIEVMMNVFEPGM